MDNYGDIRIEADNNTISLITDYDTESDDIYLKNGDIDLVTGEESIKRSIFRKIKTYFGGYSALVTTYELDQQNSNYTRVVKNDGLAYGSDLSALLSEPFNFRVVKLIKTKIQSAISSDSRISVVEVNLSLKNTSGLVSVTVKYQLAGSSNVSTVSLDLNR